MTNGVGVQLGFDARTVAPSTGYEPLPEGWYPVFISKSEQKPTKDASGNRYLALELQVYDGPFKGRTIFYNLNLWNSDAATANRAQGDLSALCHVTGVPFVNHSSELHNIPFNVKLIVSPNKEGGGSQNNVRGVKDRDGNDPGKSGAAAAPAAPQPGFVPPGGAAQPGAAPGGPPPGWAGGQPAGQPAGLPAAAPAGGWSGGAGTVAAPAGQPGAGTAQPWGGGQAAPAGQPAAAPAGQPWAQGQQPGGTPAAPWART